MGHWLRGTVATERLIAAALLAGLVVLRIVDPAPVEILRLKTFDLMQQSLPHPPSAEKPVVVVDIDEASLKTYGQWPWPRTLIASLVDRLAAAKVKAVAFDVIFAEPDRLSGPALADALTGADEATRERLRQLPSGETVLARSMLAIPVAVGVAGYSKPLGSVASAARAAPLAVLGARPEPFLLTYPGLLVAQPEIEAAAAGRGLLTVQPERDGIVRRSPSLLMAEGQMLPSIDVELLRLSGGGQPILVKSDASGVAGLVVAGQAIPADRQGQLWINFSGHDEARFVSAADVLSGAVAPERLAGKLVLIGSSAVALFDLRATPLDRVMPGVEIHAQVIENILSGRLLSRPGYAIAVELGVILGLGALIIAFVPVLGALTVLVMGALVALALAGTAWMLFVRNLTLMDLSFPLASSLAVFMTLSFFNYWREEARRTQIRGAFSQYVSPDLVETLVREPGRLKLGGETRVMTILFSDVRGFTTIAEGYKDDPQGLVALMNALLTPLTNAILETRGTIDKYMGDAILAFWNAPLDDDRHASNACLAALDMMTRLDALNAERRANAERDGRAFVPIDIGVGLNTGRCVVGNFGSDVRFDYSVLGDSVNIASRLEALTKSYGVGILAGSQTAADARGVVATLPIDSIRVKGKTEPETIHVVLGMAALERETWFAETRTALAAMRQAYAAADWERACQWLVVCRQTEAGRRLAKVLELYEGRLATLRALAGPPSGWDGVFTLTSKDG